MNVKGFMLQPVGPEALGWFKEPIKSMDDFRKYRFRTPPARLARPTRTSALPLSPWAAVTSCRLEKGTIDAAEGLPEAGHGFAAAEALLPQGFPGRR